MTEPIEPIDDKEVQADLAKASAKELRQRYNLSYTSWREDRRTCRANGWRWSKEWDDFRKFLFDMGPRACRGRVLSRIDPARLEYGPTLCEWSYRRDVLLKRPGTIMLRGEDGEWLPLVKWAEKTNQRVHTLRYRRNLGWRDHEVIAGESEAEIVLQELRQKLENACFGLGLSKRRRKKFGFL